MSKVMQIRHSLMIYMKRDVEEDALDWGVWSGNKKSDATLREIYQSLK